MKTFLKYTGIAGLALACVLLTQCELFLGPGASTNVLIDLGADAEGRASSPPPGIVSYTLTVSAPDMTTITYHISKTARYINMAVPSGANRVFRLDANLDGAYMASINQEHLYSYADEAVVDLVPGRIVMIRFTMREGEMKLIFLNPTGTSMLARVPNMHPNPSSVGDVAQFDSVLALSPHAVAYDSGQIFVLSGGSVSLYQDINDATPTIYSMAAYGIVLPSIDTGKADGTQPSLAVDPVLNRFYVYAQPVSGGQWALYYVQYAGGSGSGSLTLPAELGAANAVAAIALNEGVFYLAGNSTLPRIYRFIPGAAADWKTSPNLLNPKDVMVKGNYVYVANYPVNPNQPGTANNLATIEVFDKDTLAFAGSYGGARNTTPVDNTPGRFYGPWKFVAPSSRRFYLMDDAPGSISYGNDRIVAFDDIETMLNWDILRPTTIPNLPAYGFYFWFSC